MPRQIVTVIPIDPMVVGDSWKKGDRLPLHCTVMPWVSFSSAEEGILMRGSVRRVAHRTKPFDLLSRGRAFFGPDKTVGVHTLVRSPEIELFHTSLLVALAGQHLHPDELRYTGAGYKPHVSDYCGRFFPSGSCHRALRVALVERGEDGVKRLVERYDLAGL